MDDVDRLFQCFKCGISPPQSAVREKRKEKRKLKQDNSPKLQASTVSEKTRVNSKIGKQFSPVIFYGSPHGVPPKRPARLLRLLREIRVDLAEQNKLREEVWTTFPRQDEAMKFAKHHINTSIFSYQDHMNGQRRFLVSTYREFWRRYKEMNSKFRHHYEVIQEGLPCHLYLDLEFNKRENADKNGDEMVDLLLIVIFDALLEKYSIQGTEDFVIELDSSTEDKFSCHLIIRLPKTAFKDNSHVGAFVAEICSRIQSYRERDKKYDKLLVSKGSYSGDSNHHLFVDTAVYSRNRCFRLPFSSKAGKNSVLLPSGRFKCKDMFINPSNNTNIKLMLACNSFKNLKHVFQLGINRELIILVQGVRGEEEVFMASLICNIDVDSNKLLICKMDLDCVKILHFETEISNYNQKQSILPIKFDLDACVSDSSRTYLLGKSPFPALDAFVEAIASTGNVPGKIRSWYWFSEYGLMVYSMSRNRYCERIGREHKSNHVIYVVDMRKAAYYQKCHDPDCRGYRSPLRPIPDEVFPDANLRPDHCGEIDNWGHAYPADDERLTVSCSKEEWWHEAIKVAEQVEKLEKAPDLTQMDESCEDDEKWWMDVVNTVNEAELTYLRRG